MRSTIEIEREEDGRWIAEFPAIPGVLAYGSSRYQAIVRVLVLAISTFGDRLRRR